MIHLTHSEAFAYDLLSIADIKYVKTKAETAWSNFATLRDEIVAQIGDEKHRNVVDSPEYEQLYRVNHEMYVRIDELKARGEQFGDARYIDDRVYQRYLAKQALQKAHFPEQPLTEQKFGYSDAKV